MKKRETIETNPALRGAYLPKSYIRSLNWKYSHSLDEIHCSIFFRKLCNAGRILS